jgi:hypothetical protein
MDADQMVNLSLEGAFSILLLTLSYKLYRMKIKTHSGCCLEKGKGNGIVLDTANSGVSSEDDIINKL